MTPVGGGGGWLAFSKGPIIYLVSSDGEVCGLLNRVDQTSVDILDWSPDGRRIAYERDDDIYVINANGSGAENLTEGLAFAASAPVWSPDSRYILFSVWGLGGPDYYVVDPESRQWKVLVDVSGDTVRALWSPDGRKIAFDSTQSGNWDIYVMDVDGSGLVNVTASPDLNENLEDWSPDGARFSYNVNLGASDTEVFAINVDGTGRTNLTNDPAFEFDSVWSPDGQQIAYTHDGDIYVVGVDGSGKANLTGDLDGAEYRPVWSPDGKEVAFKSVNFDRVPPEGIYSVGLDGSAPRLLTGQCVFTGSLHDKRVVWEPLAASAGGAAVSVPALSMPTPTPTDPRFGVLSGEGKAQDKSTFVYQLWFEKSLWELAAGAGRPILTHRSIPDCRIMRAAGRGLPPDYSIQKGQKVLGGVRYQTAMISHNGELVSASYWSDLADAYGYPVGFQAGNSAECIQSAEVVLATLQIAGVSTPTP